MAQSARPDRRIAAQAAVEDAMSGDLAERGPYSLQHRQSRYAITIPADVPRNTGAAKGDEIRAFVDYQRGFIVFDLGGGGGGSDE